MSKAYYNEIDPYAAEWLNNLILEGVIADGDVDTRSIADVVPSDLTGYTQCHFFTGIGGWSYALRLAGFPDHRPVWTGSCPCQPFSSAGKQQGATDDRHLWPVWSRLIRECKPATIFGEQVAAAIGHGWLDLVFDDLEAEGYACGALVLPACSVCAPHIRQRLWFVADNAGNGRQEERKDVGRQSAGDGAEVRPAGLESGGVSRELGNTNDEGLQGRRLLGAVERRDGASECAIGSASAVGRLHDTTSSRLIAAGEGTEDETREETRLCGPELGRGSFWSACDWLPCIDGKARPVEPGTFPLVNGATARVGRLRAYGNAIVPQVAAEVVAAYLDAQQI